jgi:plasmid maintenance system killer protein
LSRPEAHIFFDTFGLDPRSIAYILIVMWTVLETGDAAKTLNKLPTNLVEKYNAWVAIVRADGPNGLRAIKGFHDEFLAGNLKGFRSSRLNIQWRIVYSVEAELVTVTVDRITPHAY